MLSNEEEAQKRELAQGFLHFLIDGAAGRTPAGRMPTLSDTVAERVAEDTRRYLDQVLPGLVDQAVARRGGSEPTQSNFGRYGLWAVIGCAILAVTCVLLAAAFVMKSGPATGVDANPPSVADDTILPTDGASVSGG